MTTRRSRWTRWTLDNVLKLLTAIAIGGSAVKAVYIYAAHDRETIRLEHENSRLEKELSEHDLDLSQSPILSHDLTVSNPKLIRAHPGGPSEYEIVVAIDIKNESQVEIHTSVVVIDFYVGILPDEVLPNADSIIVLGFPLRRWKKRNSDYGAIEWTTLIGSWVGINDDLKQTCKDSLDLGDLDLTINGFVAGDMLPGQTSSFSDRFRFKVHPGSYLGVVVSGVNGDCDRYWYNWRRRPLP